MVDVPRAGGVLRLGAYRITKGKPSPSLPRGLEVPAGASRTWPHHVVELTGSPRARWVRAIEARGVAVIEPLGAQALFVIGEPDAAAALRSLEFVSAVSAFAPAYRLTPDLAAREGRIRHVGIGVAGEHALGAVRLAIAEAGGMVHSEHAGHREPYRVLVVEVDASELRRLARLPDVRWLEYQAAEHSPDDEWSAQILAGHFDTAATLMSIPVAGYKQTLADLGLSGAGTTIAIVDTGVDTNEDATMHPDLKGRMAFFSDVTGGQTPVDGWVITTTDAQGMVEKELKGGHGTLVAATAVGNAATGVTNSEGFLLGHGVAPGATFGVVNSTAKGGGGAWFKLLAQLSSQGGATVMNNSWSDDLSQAYTDETAATDRAVRDGDTLAEPARPLTVVFSAGNKGPLPNTILTPHQGKNTIVVGATLSWGEADTHDPNEVGPGSSRGPAGDGRLLPTVVAPGDSVIGARSLVDADPAEAGTQPPTDGLTDALGPGNYPQYHIRAGTSFAAPHVSGMCALLIEWWRHRTGGRNPSPAMLKALVVNGADDLGAVPRVHTLKYPKDPVTGSFAKDPATGLCFVKGIGFQPVNVFSVLVTTVGSLKKRVVLKEPKASSIAELMEGEGSWFYAASIDTLFAPGTPQYATHPQQAPRIPNNDQGWGRANLVNIVLQDEGAGRGPRIFSDQRHAFTAAGQQHAIRVAPYDTNRPLRITLVWTDPPGAVNAMRALVNDLHLKVREDSGAAVKVYKGNVFENGFSVPGKEFDDLNNVECVYIENPSGVYDIAVIAQAIACDARPPYSLMTPWQDFALVIENAALTAPAPARVVTVLDRSGSMIQSGYEAVARTGVRQFIDHLLADDGLGCVSFADAGSVDYPLAPAKTVKTITGQVDCDAAKAAVDAVPFGGCTNMAEGILAAQALLKDAAAPRAMLLFSDGYDNKGCDAGNPAKPWAKDVAAKVPKGLRIHTCAMGAASDQALLSGIATGSAGLYYYMPSIDDLFEICGYVRGLVSGENVIVNEPGSASHSQVAAFVDRSATRARFSVAWADSGMHFVARAPKGPGEVTVRLRMPGGRLLHPQTSALRRTAGDGYVIFDIDEPQAGGWAIEVETAQGTHVRYTASAFVTSPLALKVTARAGKIASATPIDVTARVFDAGDALDVHFADARVVSPAHSVAALLKTHRDRLKKVSPPGSSGGDALPLDIARLLALREQDLRAGRGDLLAHRESVLRLSPGGSGARTASRGLAGRFTGGRGTSQNVKLTVRGTSPRTGRFVRTGMVSVWVGERARKR